MPEIQPVYAAKNGQPAGHIEHPTADEAYATALRTELGGYQALLDAGRTERGGESIAEIMTRIEAEISRVLPEGYTAHFDRAPLAPAEAEPVPVDDLGDRLATAFKAADDDVPPPVRRKR